jgi:hypothetical protein
MKTIGMLSVVALVVAGWITSYGQVAEPEVPGDHFSLEGALELFKQSESPEEFEQKLNSRESKVNNLDLNGDGYIDYIRVIDRYEGNVHAFILQAVISEREYQDVAVIELEKLANGKAVLQIIGDEDVYGVETIIEPTREVRTYAGATTTRTVVNVWAWPSVQYVYSPYYDVWTSPWAWHVHPIWWRPWRPVTYVHYYSYWRPYRPYYSVCHTHRVVYAHRIYHPHRTTSIVVRDRHHDQISRYRSSRHDGDRYRSSRNEDGRSYSNNDRSAGRDGDQFRRDDRSINRRSSSEREILSSPDRSGSRDRNKTDNDNYRGAEREASSDRRSVTLPHNGEIHKNAASPAANRSRSIESSDMERRSIPVERNTPANIQRNPAGMKKYEAPDRRPVTTPDYRERRDGPSREINRSRTYETPGMQRPTSRQRSSSADFQRAPESRSAVHSNREISRQPSRPSAVDRSRPSSEGNHAQQRPSGSGSRSNENKRGRQ